MKKKISLIISFLIIPAVILTGSIVFKDKQYAFVSAAVTVMALAQFLISFERKENSETKLVLVAVMTALSVVGRMIFAAIPGFKPVTALVVITAVYFGRQAGFVTGSLSALLSNFYFGQGAWTPFQMLSWGIIGWVAGVFAPKIKKSKVVLSVFGFFSGIAYSLMMDVWTTVWADGTFNLTRYFSLIVSALPYTAMYAVSNIIFLLLLEKPIGKKLERINDKYGL